MKNHIKVLLLISFLLMFVSGPAFAKDEIKGRIESIDPVEQSFVVKGTRIFVTRSTDYEDHLKGFTGLREGQKVEVEYKYRDGKNFATEIELED
jgi:hypothetical protein